MADNRKQMNQNAAIPGASNRKTTWKLGEIAAFWTVLHPSISRTMMLEC